MDFFRSSDGVLDYTPLALCLIAAVLAIAAAGIIAIALKIHQNRQEEAKEAIAQLKESLGWLYLESGEFTDEAGYEDWEASYIQAVTAMFGSRIWRRCVQSRTLPPLKLVFGEPVH